MKDKSKNNVIITLSVIIGVLLILGIINISSKSNQTGNDILLNDYSTLQNSYDEKSQQLQTCQSRLSSSGSNCDSLQSSGNTLLQNFQDYVTCRGTWQITKDTNMANELATIDTSCFSLPVSQQQNTFCNDLNNYYQKYFNSNSNTYYGDPTTCVPNFHYP